MAKQVIIKTPVINSPFEEPRRHYRFDDDTAFTESPGEMVRRVCRGLGKKRNIVVLNDEAHHCYRLRFPVRDVENLTDEDLLREVMNTVGKTGKREAKASTADALWGPSVNNAGEWGRWKFVEITDPWDGAAEIRRSLTSQPLENGH